MVHHAIYKDKLPEKWAAKWRLIKSGKDILLLNEPQIAEIFFKLERSYGQDEARTYIFRIKCLDNSRLIPRKEDDNLSFYSGHIRNQYRKFGISSIDSYLISIAKHENATLFSTDLPLRNVARKEKISVDYLPKESLGI